MSYYFPQTSSLMPSTLPSLKELWPPPHPIPSSSLHSMSWTMVPPSFPVPRRRTSYLKMAISTSSIFPSWPSQTLPTSSTSHPLGTMAESFVYRPCWPMAIGGWGLIPLSADFSLAVPLVKPTRSTLTHLFWPSHLPLSMPLTPLNKFLSTLSQVFWLSLVLILSWSWLTTGSQRE